MKIAQFSVKNYRSLRNIKLEDIGNLTILIGTNSSGKSNILEALMLFFNEIDPALERSMTAVDEYAWFDREFGAPVHLEVTLELSKEEVTDFLPPILTDAISPKDKNMLTILRSISGKPQAALWRTEAIRFNSELLMQGGKFVFKLADKAAELDAAQKVATLPAEFLGPILQKITKQLKGRFRLISAARNNPTTPSGLAMRSAFIPASYLVDLTSLGQPFGRPREDERKWIAIDEKLKGACRNIADVRVMNNRFTIREKASDMFFPIEATGGGHQEVMALLCQLLKEEDALFGIEEPESHLHAELSRKFFSIIKEISMQSQIFITTHSPIFVDHADLANTWLVRKINKSTSVTRLSGPKDLRNVLQELGLRPSDVFYADGVIFVEGLSDRVVFPIWAQKLGIDFDEFGISVIPTNGKSSGRYHLTVWMDATENTGIPYYFILDNNAEKEAKKLSKKLTVGENLFLLKKNCLEDYFPNQHILEALKAEYDIDVTKEEEELLVVPKDIAIENLILSKKKDATGWKPEIGRIVAESMSVEEIDDEIKGILERIRTNLIRRSR